MKHAVMLTEYMRTVYSQPDIEKARKHADAFLPKVRVRVRVRVRVS